MLSTKEDIMAKLQPTPVGLVVVGAGLLLSSLVEAQISSEADSDIERCLLEGKVVKRLKVLRGATDPLRILIDCDGEQRSAVFKSVDEHRRGRTNFEFGDPEINFSDSYKYERAAYLLDRELGLNMVPVAVLRPYKGDRGALVSWIDDASHQVMMKQQPTGPQVAHLAQQKHLMRLFDALILNVDRRPGNWLVDNEDWKLYLIDHSRSFRVREDLPEEFLDDHSRLSRDLYQRLRALDESRLTELLDNLLSKAQIRTLLARRDRIVEKVDSDCLTNGDEQVFLAN
jgi:hypothetical protein